jgi:hypothetical protein
VNRLKRKPFLFGAAGAAVLLVAAAWMFASPSAAEAPRLERLLPAETVGFVQVNNLRAQALKIMESDAWRELSKENQAASSLFMMGANHTGALDASYALALVGMDAAEGDRKPQPQFVLVAEFGSWDSRRNFDNRVLRSLRESSKKGVTIAEQEYEGATIHVVTSDGREDVTFARKDQTLYLSNSVGALKKVLDVRAKKAKSLEASENFAPARARASVNDGMFGYLDGAALTRLVESAPSSEGNPGVAAFRQLFRGAGASSVQSVAFTSAFDGGRVVERFAVNTSGKEGVLGTIATNAPTSQALLALVPEDALQAFDASIAGAPQTFDQMLSLAGEVAAQSGKNPQDLFAEVSNKTGIDLRNDLIGLLGAEVCVAQLRDGEDRSGVFILNVKDEQAFARTLEKFAEHKKSAVTSRDYKGVAVRRIAGEDGRGLEYAFVGGNLVASSEGRMVERVIDTAQGGPSLAGNAAFREAGAGVSNPQFVYFNTNADYVRRLSHTLKSEDYEFKSSGDAATLKPSYAFGVSRPEGLFVESHTPLGTFPRLLAAMTSKLGQETDKEESKKEEPKKATTSE